LSVDAICWFSGVHLAATKRRENCFRRFSLVNKAGRYCSNKSFCIPSPGLISPHTIDSVTEISFTLSFSKRNCRPGRISHKKKNHVSSLITGHSIQQVNFVTRLNKRFATSCRDPNEDGCFITTQAMHSRRIKAEIMPVYVRYIGNGCTS